MKADFLLRRNNHRVRFWQGLGSIMQSLRLSLLFSIVVTAAVVGVASQTIAFDLQAAENTTTAVDTGSGPLDGLVFTGALGLDGKPKDIPDSFVFENGTFLSKECELRCKYPARPYFVRVNGSKTEFISESKCPYKDARIVWRGSVEGNSIKGTSTWVVKRWYWTVENTFEFEGKLVQKLTSTPSTE